METIPVCVFVAVMLTPGINAFDASDAVPPNVAFVVCANELPRRTKSSIVPASQYRFIDSSTPMVYILKVAAVYYRKKEISHGLNEFNGLESVPFVQSVAYLFAQSRANGGGVFLIGS